MDFPSGEFSEECLHCYEQMAPSPLLCFAHQIWNCDEHLFTCHNQPSLDLERYFVPWDGAVPTPVIFTGDSEGEFAKGHRNAYIRTLDDLLAAEPAFIKSFSHCLICQQISRAYEGLEMQLDKTRIAIFRPFAATPLKYERDEKGIEQADPYIVRCVLPVILCEEHASSNCTYRTIYLPLELSYESSGIGLVDARPWDRSYMDFDFVRRWLRLCEASHGNECHGKLSATKLPSGHRMIDTKERCIVAEPDDLDCFVALSYMWSSATGGTDIQLVRANQEDLRCRGALHPTLLPHVIEDSITLCRSLGYRYLWVDRLCIIQDDARSKHSQIQAMDAIYSLADLTFVALTDGKTAVGLPGSPNRPRTQKLPTDWHEWQLERLLKKHVALPPAKIVERSTWGARGWTFQERLLSRRRLYISANQVLICCGWLASNTNAPLSSEEITHQMNPNNIGIENQSEPGVQRVNRFSVFRRTIEQYSQTVLSFDSDILNAMTGVTNVVGKILSTRFRYGHPERFFPECLIWAPIAADSHRRADSQIPSWSWAGWTGPIRYSNAIFLITSYGVGTLVNFHIVDAKDTRSLRRIQAAAHWFSAVTDGPVDEYPDAPKREMVDWEQDMQELWQRSHPECLKVWKECPHNPTESMKRYEISSDIVKKVLHRGSELHGSLVFNTSRAFLGLTRDPSSKSSEVAYLEASGVVRHNMETLIIRDRAGYRIGAMMLMKTEWIARHIDMQKDLHEFIVLGAGMNVLLGRHERVFGEEYSAWGLFVMLVEKVEDDDDTLYRKRIAIGFLAAESWKDAQPEWATVILS